MGPWSEVAMFGTQHDEIDEVDDDVDEEVDEEENLLV